MQALREQFTAIFGPAERLHMIRAPGRVNLIGEHTDYNDGFVFPMAIEPEVRIVCRGRDDGRARVASALFPGEIVEFSVDDRIAPGKPKWWANYVLGVAAELIGAGIPLTGIDALITNSLPKGGGLSSSAALEVGFARALLAVGGLEMDLSRLAKLCQNAEHHFANVPCGIMDQTIVAGAREGHAMLLDCRSLAKQFVPIDSNELRVVIFDSDVKHELAGGEYRIRREQCEAGVKALQRTTPSIKALRDATLKQVEQLAGSVEAVVVRRCRHVVTENQRTVDAAQLLGRREYEELGRLMYESHESLRKDYEVTVPQTDALVELCRGVKGVYGARMTGGGFGGCVIAIVQPRAVDALIEHVQTAYTRRYPKLHLASYVTRATGGASAMAAA